MKKWKEKITIYICILLENAYFNERLSTNWNIRKGVKIILLILLYLWGQENYKLKYEKNIKIVLLFIFELKRKEL